MFLALITQIHNNKYDQSIFFRKKEIYQTEYKYDIIYIYQFEKCNSSLTVRITSVIKYITNVKITNYIIIIFII